MSKMVDCELEYPRINVLCRGAYTDSTSDHRHCTIGNHGVGCTFDKLQDVLVVVELCHHAGHVAD